jgi:hypothetical protein
LASDLKSFRQRLSVVGGKIVEIKKNSEKVAPKEPAKPVVKVEAPVVEAPKAVVKPETREQARPQTNARPNTQGQRNGYNGGNFQNGYNRNDRNGQGQQRQNAGGYQGQRPNGGRFTPTGERRFDNGRDYSGRQGSFNGNREQFNRNGAQGQNAGGFKKPFGAQGQGSGFTPRLPRPTESFDASTLAKSNTNRNAPKKKSYEKNGEEKKSLNKKALMMRGYIDENGVEDENLTTVRRYSKKTKEEAAPVKPIIKKIEHAVITTDNLTVKILAETIGKSVPELMGKFLLLGMMVNINSNIDY